MGLSEGVLGELGAIRGNKLACQIEGEFGKFEEVGGLFHLDHLIPYCKGESPPTSRFSTEPKKRFFCTKIWGIAVFVSLFQMFSFWTETLYRYDVANICLLWSVIYVMAFLGHDMWPLP